MSMKIAIVGTGYVGLSVGTCFSEIGHEVICFDKSKNKIDLLNENKIFIYEPGLEKIVVNNRKSGRLKFTSCLATAVKSADVIILAVGTPTDPETGHVDLIDIKEASRKISTILSLNDGYKVIAIKSTVPPGSNEIVAKMIVENNQELKFDVVSVPEFLREGMAIVDFMEPDRIIIGVESKRAKKVMVNLYSSFISRNISILFCQIRSAEMIKYAANCFLGIKISFINQISDLCEVLDADIRDVSKGIGLDKRIGIEFLRPGPGFGGSCFPKDMLEILTTSCTVNVDLSIIRSALDYNTKRSQIMADKILNIIGKNLTNKSIGVLGLAFKANTDDVREAPSIHIINKLLKCGLKIRAFDPKAIQNAKENLLNIKYSKNIYDVAKGGNALVILTPWDEFKNFNYKELLNIMKTNIIIDFCNILNPNEIRSYGFDYYSIGFK